MASAIKTRVYQNRLLSALSPSDLALFTPELEFKEFALRQVFETPNRPIKDIYFFERGIASVVAKGNGTNSIEVGLIGREGVSGVAVILGGDRSPHSTYAQVPGAAHRTSLRGLLLRFANTFMVQAAQAALANGRYPIEQRLARWILMAHDRINSDALPLTHEFLSIMLGVRRAGVTVALHILQQRGLIRSQRGQIAVVNRAGLERLTDGAYGIPESEYRRLIG
jgi:CRP-like cAMP-binding protein